MKLMERILFNLFIMVSFIFFLGISPAILHSETITAPIEIYFSPEDNVAGQIIRHIDESTSSIYVLVYSFTDRDISNALIRAHKRGVDVQIIIDGGQTDHYKTQADEVQSSGIPTFMDTKYQIAHDKVMVFDGKVVLMGSYNFTKAAKSINSENIAFIYNEVIAKKYLARWEYRKHYTVQYR